MATYTFTPYNNLSDGYMTKDLGSGDSWGDAHDATTATALINNLTTNIVKAELENRVGSPPTMARIYRAYLAFDTAPTIADDEEILGGRIKLYMTPSFNSWEDSSTTYTCAIVAADFFNDITTTTADYNDFGSDLLSDEITLTKSEGTGARWVTFTLNATGLTKIIKAAGTYSAFGIRMKDDIDNTEPIRDNNNEISFISKRTVSTTYHPVLEVDYPGPVLKVYNGTEWVNAHLKRYNGTAWEDAVLKYYDGDSFELVDAAG